jgi:hypothetical protein
MTDPIRAALRKSTKNICSYAGGPSSFNSCCQGVARCEEIAAQVIHDFLRDLPDGSMIVAIARSSAPNNRWQDAMAAAVLAAAKEDQK